MSWDRFNQLKQRLAEGDAAGVLEPLQTLRQEWPEPALATVLAQLGQITDAAAAFRRSHALQGWTASEERGYTFSHDYFSSHIPIWRQSWIPSRTTPHLVSESAPLKGASADTASQPRGAIDRCRTGAGVLPSDWTWCALAAVMQSQNRSAPLFHRRRGCSIVKAGPHSWLAPVSPLKVASAFLHQASPCPDRIKLQP